MKKILSYIKNNIFKIFISILLVVLILILSSDPKEFAAYSDHSPTRVLNYSDKITCSYPQFLSAYYDENKIKHSLPDPEVNPTIFTFTELDKDIAKLSYIDATRTINTAQVVKIIDKSDRIILLEGGSENYFTTHTIFKETGVSVYTKTVINPFGTPVGSMAMGSCTGF